eukprot:427913_1
MSDEKTPYMPSIQKWSLLSLCCPGSGKNKKGTARKIAVKSDKTVYNVDKSVYNPYVISLNGCNQDATTISRWFDAACKTQKVKSFQSDQSCVDAQLTVSSAKKRISKWLGKDDGETMFVFYYSGHGADGGICLHKDMLKYKKLLRYFKNKRAMIIIDACHSGSIEDAYFDDKKKRDYFGVGIFYACLKDEVSCDMGHDGGYFTQTYFKCRNMEPFVNLVFDNIKPVKHEYPDGTSSTQTCGARCHSIEFQRLLENIVKYGMKVIKYVWNAGKDFFNSNKK